MYYGNTDVLSIAVYEGNTVIRFREFLLFKTAYEALMRYVMFKMEWPIAAAENILKWLPFVLYICPTNNTIHVFPNLFFSSYFVFQERMNLIFNTERT